MKKKKYWVGFMSADVYNVWREWLLGGKKEKLREIHDLIADMQGATVKMSYFQKYQKKKE